MIGKRRRVRRTVTRAAILGVLLAAFPCAAADRDQEAPTDDEPRCDRQDDLSYTIVRETAAGVWVWTERFRPAAPNGARWSIAVGTGVAGATPTVKFLPSPPVPATPNGAPILE